ncbi:MAG: DUF357 domain-containing protein [Candidatus Diapherotrites archaeon]|nr:DUF357 domain-containing protein [Candidatus Diapherotrites archaeon]MDZ4256869.1 DUF357 domain-containing protein [archaeon]
MNENEQEKWRLENEKLRGDLEIRVEKYKNTTQSALQKVSLIPKKDTKEYTIAMDFLTMANHYFNDGLHFQTQGDLLLALASFSYAHAWLDAGVRAGIMDGKDDDKLFTLP